jgi:hypothetical protein
MGPPACGNIRRSASGNVAIRPSGILLYETNIFQFEVKNSACYTRVLFGRFEMSGFEALVADLAAGRLRELLK